MAMDRKWLDEQINEAYGLGYTHDQVINFFRNEAIPEVRNLYNQAYPAPPPPSIGREAGIIGAHALAPIAGAPGSLLNLATGQHELFGQNIPTISDIRKLGPVPSGDLEHNLADVGTAIGTGLGAVPLAVGSVMAGGPAAGLLGIPAAMGASEAFRAGRQELFPDVPLGLGPVVDTVGGLLSGGWAGEAGPAALRAVSGVERQAVPTAAAVGAAPSATRDALRFGLAQTVGAGVDLAARHMLGFGPGSSWWLSQIPEYMAFRAGAALPRPSISGLTGAAEGFLGPPTEDENQLSPR